MQERKRNEVSNSFDWRRTVWTSEPFGNHDNDPTVKIRSTPATLLQHLAVKERETKGFLIPISIDIWEVLLGRQFVHEGIYKYVLGLYSRRSQRKTVHI